VPLYEYTCATCHDAFTLLQSIHARAEDTVCPACGGRKVTRRMSAFAPSIPGGGAAAQAGRDAPGPCGMPGGGCGGGMCGR
jgi:putative FmdB family regulatory protein